MLGQQLNKLRNIIDRLRAEIKGNPIKCLIQTREGKIRWRKKANATNSKQLNMVDINPITLIIALNMNKYIRDCQSGLIKTKTKKDPSICCLQEAYFEYKDICRLNVKGQRNICHANANQKKAGVTVLISDKADFRRRKTIRDLGIT